MPVVYELTAELDRPPWKDIGDRTDAAPDAFRRCLVDGGENPRLSQPVGTRKAGHASANDRDAAARAGLRGVGALERSSYRGQSAPRSHARGGAEEFAPRALFRVPPGFCGAGERLARCQPRLLGEPRDADRPRELVEQWVAGHEAPRVRDPDMAYRVARASSIQSGVGSYRVGSDPKSTTPRCGCLTKEIANMDRNTPTIRAVVNKCRTCRRTRRQRRGALTSTCRLLPGCFDHEDKASSDNHLMRIVESVHKEVGDMSALIRWSVLLVVCSVAFGTAVPVDAQQAPPPVITSVQPDLTKGTLKIDGASFPANPEVWLSSLRLTVFMATSSEIESELPPDILPASYLLFVSGGGRNATAATFVVTVGAVGPQGPAGENGPQGIAGPAGPQGPRDQPVRRG